MQVLLRSAPMIAATAALVAACGGGSAPARTHPALARTAPAPAADGAAAVQADWPEFGFDAQRSNASTAATGIDASNLARLRRRRVALPGTVDSSPIYLHGVTVGGGAHDVFVLTTTYGRTLAIDATAGRILWEFAPRGIGDWEGSQRITNAAPIADPDRKAVYAASPDGLIHKLALADGREEAGWPARVTLEPGREKLPAALNISGASVIVTTGGYLGDAPPYQGHVVTIDRASARVTHVFNTLCADRHRLIAPASCPASGSAIWARSGAVVEPSGRLLVATGNGPYNGRTNFGDSVLELDGRSLHLRQAYTPPEQAQLEATDTDLGSTAPVLLPGGLAVMGGKDGKLRLLDLHRLNGRRAGRPFRTGGELQKLDAPGGQQLFAALCVWHRTVFVASAGGTAAYALRGRRLHPRWGNGTHGSSPVIAGGLLWVYDIDGGGLNVYQPGSGRRLATLDAGGGHWNSPVIAGGHVALPEGNANDHATSGTLNLYSIG